MLEAFYDNAGTVIKTLNDEGALLSAMAHTHGGEATPDYFAHLDENVPKRGRTTDPLNSDGKGGYGGDIIRMLGGYAEAKGSPVVTDTQVSKIVLDEKRRRRRRRDHRRQRSAHDLRDQGRDLRFRRLHPEPGDAPELSARAGAGRLCRARPTKAISSTWRSRSAPSSAT